MLNEIFTNSNIGAVTTENMGYSNQIPYFSPFNLQQNNANYLSSCPSTILADKLKTFIHFATPVQTNMITRVLAELLEDKDMASYILYVLHHWTNFRIEITYSTTR